MKFRSLLVPTSIVLHLAGASIGFAASQTWDGDTDANWSTAANWVGNAVPGIVYTANNTNTADVATFNSEVNPVTLAGSAANPILTETNRMIGRIVFDTAAAGSFHIGSLTTPPTLTFGNNLVIVDVTAEVTQPQVFNAPVALHLPSSTNGGFTIQNNAAVAGATLNLAGGILNSPNSSRGTVATLRGSNTGENTIGNITLTNTGGVTSSLTKADAGTWVLGGTNLFASAGGVIVTDGTLAAASSNALGSNANANAQAATINGGVLEIRSGLVIDNGVSLNLNNGGTIRAAGSTATNGRINIGTAAAGNVTITTNSAGDVFTLGADANDFTGGAADSVVHIAGAGMVVQAAPSNYAGTWSVDAGVLRLGTPTSLGVKGAVSIAAGAGLQTHGNSITLTSLAGAGSVTNGAPDSVSTVVANIAATDTFAGQLADGAGGTLALTKSGAGVLTLSGANTYSGDTLVNSGVLNLTGSLGNSYVSGLSGTTLAGSGSTTGLVYAAGGMHLAPGDGGNGATGALTVGSLELGPGSELDFDVASTASLDRINVATSGGLTIRGGTVNLNGGSGAFTTNGVYNLIAYTGTLKGSGVSALTLNGLNKSVTKTYTFGTSGGFITLTVANSGVVQTFWNTNADGNWSTAANWTPATVPNGNGAFVGFGGGGTEASGPRTITVNGGFTAGMLAFNGTAGGSYTLAAGSGASLTLNNGSADAFVTNAAGNHSIQAPLTLGGVGATFSITGTAGLTVGGVIDGFGTALTKSGTGTLVLNGVNIYQADTVIQGGVIEINNSSSLGDPAHMLIVNNGTLRTTADITSTRNFNFSSPGSTLSVAAGTTYTIDGLIADGANVGILNKTNTGTLVLNGVNTYTGGTVIQGGMVKVNNPSSLGDASSPVTLQAATLQATAGFTGARAVSLASASSAIGADAEVTYVINGQVGGTGALNKVGPGTLTLGANSNNYSGGTVLSEGMLAVNAGSFLGPGTLTFMGGTLQNNYGTNATYGFGNPIVVPAGQTGTINMGSRMGLGGGAAVTGAGTLNVNFNTTVTRDDLSNDWSGFSGLVRFAGSGTGRMLNNGGNFNVNGFANCTVDLGGTAFLQPVTNSNGNTYVFGALSGSAATAGITGGTAGRATLSVGGLNTDTTFAGQILGNSALTKVGTGTLTLSGANTYTGNTTISDGTLALASGGSLNFAPAANGVSNKITGAGAATLDGYFNFDLANATITDGNSWTIVDVTTRTFGTTFTVVGFDDADNDNVWTKVDGANTWSFDEETGVLSLTSSSQYAAWASGAGLNGTNDGAAQDPDADGISNALEFVLGGNPLAADSGKLPVLTTTPADFVFTFSRSDASESEIALVFQYGTSLGTWTDVAIGAASAGPVAVTENDADPDTIVITIPRSTAVDGRLFGRLRAVK